MSLQQVTEFFLWCAVMNGCVLLVWSLIVMAVPEALYRFHARWFPLPEDTFTAFMYGFLGLFKILVIVFNVVPLLALLVVR